MSGQGNVNVGLALPNFIYELGKLALLSCRPFDKQTYVLRRSPYRRMRARFHCFIWQREGLCGPQQKSAAVAGCKSPHNMYRLYHAGSFQQTRISRTQNVVMVARHLCPAMKP